MNIEKYKEDIVTTSEEEVQTSDDLNTKNTETTPKLDNTAKSHKILRICRHDSFEIKKFVSTFSLAYSLDNLESGSNNLEGRRTIFEKDLEKIYRNISAADELKMVVMLENDEGYRMYLSIVTNIDEKLSLLLGCTLSDEFDTSKVSLVIPCKNIETIVLQGEGGLLISAFGERDRVFYPKTIKSLWRLVQILFLLRDKIPYLKRNIKDNEFRYYYDQIIFDPYILSFWNKASSLASFVKIYPPKFHKDSSVYKKITSLLTSILNEDNINTITISDIRRFLKKNIDYPLEPYNAYIENETMRIFGQVEKCSKIQENLYLGSEWNASDRYYLEELGVKGILNVSVEIDNFFPGVFDYLNISIYDSPEADIITHFEKAHKFIDKYIQMNESVLVHCQMGISRSASIVISYMMKRHGWSLDITKNYVREKRPIINPNSGFHKQLLTYEGILRGSRNRNLFSSEYKSNLDQNRSSDSKNITEIEQNFPIRKSIDFDSNSHNKEND